MTLPLALLGAKGLYLLFIWLLSAIAATWLSSRAGYGERWGLASGLLLTVFGAIIWLVIYLVRPRPGSLRAVEGVMPKRHSVTDG
jgi:hypothetical protein